MLRKTGLEKDPFSQLPKMLERIQEAMHPLAGMQNNIQALAARVSQPTRLELAIKKFVTSNTEITKAFETLKVGPVDEFAKKLAQDTRRTRPLENAGWLPHYTTPFDIVELRHTDTTLLQDELLKYYKENWQNVRQKIETQLAGYDLDEESKATFREALDAHEGGLYRSVCRVLFPEIERIARRELHGGKIQKHIASQSCLRNLAGQMVPTALDLPEYYVLVLFKQLNAHVYQSIANSNDLKLFEQDPVPNRHAAMHGLINYRSTQNSLNMLFLADYIVQVIDFFK